MISNDFTTYELQDKFLEGWLRQRVSVSSFYLAYLEPA